MINLFDQPVGSWHSTDKKDYPAVDNQVQTDRGTVYVSIPPEFYMILQAKKINQVSGFTLDGNRFIAHTDRGDLNLWKYKTRPDWAK